MDSLTSWLVVTIALFVLGVLSPVVGAIRTYRQGVRRIAKAERDHLLTVELQAKWAAETDGLLPPLGADPRTRDEYSKASAALNAKWRAKFEEVGLRPLDMGALTRMMNGDDSVSLMRLLIDRNGFNLALILTGPVLATTASIIALFPNWDLP